MQGQDFVEFERPIRTLSVAIPDYVSYTDQVQSKLEQLASTASHNGWRLREFRVQVDPHGAGGGPSGSYDKVTIYPITVAKAGRAVDQSREASSTESRHDQGLNQPAKEIGRAHV